LKRTHMLAGRDLVDEIIGLISEPEYLDGITEKEIVRYRKGKSAKDVLWLLVQLQMLRKEEGKYVPTEDLRLYAENLLVPQTGSEDNCRRFLIRAFKKSDTYFHDLLHELTVKEEVYSSELSRKYELTPPVYANLITWLRSSLRIVDVRKDNLGNEIIRLDEEGVRLVRGDGEYPAAEFWKAVEDFYFRLVNGKSMKYVEIEHLAENVGNQLGISSKRFYELFYGPIRPTYRYNLVGAPGHEGFKYFQVLR